jgi:DMSO/TMAO reductase YedYZ heme-binding membrane subunit
MESVLWYATRGAGIVSLLLLTAVMCLGLLTAGRWQRPGWPRFLTAQLHGNLALLTIAFVAIHVLIAVFDPFTSLGLTSALVPFSSPYKQLWLGLGGVTLYLFAALIVSSLARARIGRRAWRAIHWLAYGAWPLAVLHGLGTGTDTVAPWMWLINAACVGAVAASGISRVRATTASQASIQAALPSPGGRS